MKWTKKILIGIMLVLCCSMVVSAFMLKKEYDKNDKGEIYFLYGTILEQPFRHLVITGGNISNIIYEPSAKPSVRVFKQWWGYHDKRVTTMVRNDTLYLYFPDKYKDLYEKNQIKNGNMVRIFSPELISVTGSNTNLRLLKLNQQDLTVNISGKSNFEVESLSYNFGNISIKASDTTAVVFEISPTLKKAGTENENEIPADVKGWDAFHIKNLIAEVSGNSFVDVGHAQIDSIDFKVSDTSAIVLSGGTIKKHFPGNR
ncbi:hypothetical protein SAMN05518672_108123 [Chitinophaga sp. CF118]|nr:hypothetical protein SAMN05518672_108123 [Chitinophaga sp. CF118]